MTVDEALRELGLSGQITPEEIRRAYLLLLKTRKPEVDPEGFKRLREAYEMVRGRCWRPRETVPVASAAPIPIPSPPSPPADGAAPSVPAPAPGGSKPVKPSPTPAPEPRPAARPPVHAAPAAPTLSDFVVRVRELPADSGHEPAIKILRQAVAALPASADARWMLFDRLIAAKLEDDAMSVLEQAHAAGLPGFLAELLARRPASVTAERLDAVARSEGPRCVSVLAGSFAGAGDAASAARMAGVAIEKSSDPGLVSMLAAPVLDAILAQWEAGRWDEGASLWERQSKWLTGNQPRFGERTTTVQAKWMLVKELAQLSADFPPQLRKALARAVRLGDLELAREAALDLAREHPSLAIQGIVDAS